MSLDQQPQIGIVIPVFSKNFYSKKQTNIISLGHVLWSCEGKNHLLVAEESKRLLKR